MRPRTEAFSMQNRTNFRGKPKSLRPNGSVTRNVVRFVYIPLDPHVLPAALIRQFVAPEHASALRLRIPTVYSFASLFAPVQFSRQIYLLLLSFHIHTTTTTANSSYIDIIPMLTLSARTPSYSGALKVLL